MKTNIYHVVWDNELSYDDHEERHTVVSANSNEEAIEKSGLKDECYCGRIDADLKFEGVTIPDSNFTKIPTKTGYYWFQPYNPTTGLADCWPEIVRVAFGFTFRRKVVNRVIAKFWQCNLEEVTNVYWSEEIMPPVFPGSKENA